MSYSADDADSAYSLKDTPEAADTADAAKQDITVSGVPSTPFTFTAGTPGALASNTG